MKIKPLLNYHLLGTSIKLNKNKKYKALIASNIPEFKEKGLIFVKGILLDKNEYVKV